MRILVIGGSGFIGPHVVREFQRLGHSVVVFHRGNTPLDLPVEQVLGDRRDLSRLKPKADVVVDLILSSGKQAQALMDTYRGHAGRVVVASSIDVYRACGVLHGLEEGPLEPIPLTEDSALRTKLQTYPAEQIKKLQGVFGWLDDNYDKIPVERAALSEPQQLPGTVLRLPMIYGPGDRLSRLRPVLQQMDSGQAEILFQEKFAEWRTPRGYVENVAAAIALAAVSAQAAGRVYNVAEKPAFSEIEWAGKIAAVVGWKGKLVTLPKGKMPEQLRQEHGNPEQHWEADSSRIRRELAYQESVGLDEALRRTVEWERRR